MNRSIPIAKALDDTMIALYQNGERIAPSNGYPMRLLVPGYEGNMNVKWLHRIKLVEAPVMAINAETGDGSGDTGGCLRGRYFGVSFLRGFPRVASWTPVPGKHVGDLLAAFADQRRQKPAWRMPCFSQIRSVSFSNRDSSAGMRPGTQR